MYDKDGKITATYALIADVMNSIISVCGYSGYSDMSGILTMAITKVDKNKLDGRSCRDILDELTRTCASFAMVQGDTGTSNARGILVFIPMNVGAGSVYTANTGKYDKLRLGGIKRVSAVELSSGGKTYSAGSASSPFGTLAIETPYASEAAAGAVYGILKDYEYRAWECEKMLLDSFIPLPSSIIKFPEGDMYVNHCTVYLTSSGIYASLGRNAVSEDEIGYLTRTERELEQRYRMGDVKNNTVIDEDGIQFVFENKNGVNEKYGFETFAGGLTAFGGAMLDSIMPDEIVTVSETDTAVEQRIVYGGKTYTLKYTKDGTKKSNISFEEVVV